MTTLQTNNKKLLAALLISLVILGYVVIFLFIQLNEETTNANSQISSLNGRIAQLQGDNAILQSELASASANSSLSQANPSFIYSIANASVVTVAGDTVTNVSTLFGLEQVYSSVLGSGFVIRYNSSYYILTNFHVVNSVRNLSVTFWDGNSYNAKVIGEDQYSDLAVLSVQAPASEFIPLSLTTSSTLQVGQSVFVIGNPYGLSGSFSSGIISQLGRTIQESTTNGFSIPDVIQFTAPINPGNSGGPLLNANGSVIGITTAIVSGSQGVGFAIPSDTILRELPYLISNGSYDLHPYIGIGGVDMNLQLAYASGTNITYGVLVEQVFPSSPAAVAGLKGGNRVISIAGQQYLVGGDIIVSVNGTKVINQDGLSSYLEEHAVSGQIIQLGVIRAGSFIQIELKLGSRP
ncbi:MAG: trypsin-like peptidase domain-containing protein [Conexivisphaerales archaeon]